MNTWREINLVEGNAYRLAQSVSTPMGSFKEGEVVVFEGSSYSCYDSATILSLKTESGEIKQFFLHDDAELPIDLFYNVNKIAHRYTLRVK